MALTRKMLRAMGIEDEKIDQIIDAHTETVDGLKDQLKESASNAEKVTTLQKQIEKMTDDAKESGENSPYKVKYDELKTEFDEYKRSITEQQTKNAKETAYKNLLKSAGLKDTLLDKIARITDFGTIELEADGKIKDSDKLIASIKTEYADFIVTSGEKPDNPANPPQNGGTPDYDSMSDAEYYAATYAKDKK